MHAIIWEAIGQNKMQITQMQQENKLQLDYSLRKALITSSSLYLPGSISLTDPEFQFLSFEHCKNTENSFWLLAVFCSVS